MQVIKLASTILTFSYGNSNKNAAEPQGNVSVIQMFKLLIGIAILFANVHGSAK